MVPIHPYVNRAKMLFSYIVVPYEGWNRTEFWTQNSRLSPDFIPKQKCLFSDSRLSNRWVMETLKNAGALQTYGQDWIRFDPNEKKNHLESTCCSFEKKTMSRLFIIFSKLYPYFPDFFQAWKVAGEISRLFQEFKTPCEPWFWEERKLTMENGSSLPLLKTIFPDTPLSQCHFVYSQAIPRFLDHLRSGWLPLKVNDLSRNRKEK